MFNDVTEWLRHIVSVWSLDCQLKTFFHGEYQSNNFAYVWRSRFWRRSVKWIKRSQIYHTYQNVKNRQKLLSIRPSVNKVSIIVWSSNSQRAVCFVSAPSGANLAVKSSKQKNALQRFEYTPLEVGKRVAH